MPMTEAKSFSTSARWHPAPSGLASKNPCFWHPEAISGQFLTALNRHKRKEKGRLRFSVSDLFMEAAGVHFASRRGNESGI